MYQKDLNAFCQKEKIWKFTVQKWLWSPESEPISGCWRKRFQMISIYELQNMILRLDANGEIIF